MAGSLRTPFRRRLAVKRRRERHPHTPASCLSRTGWATQATQASCLSRTALLAESTRPTLDAQRQALHVRLAYAEAPVGQRSTGRLGLFA